MNPIPANLRSALKAAVALLVLSWNGLLFAQPASTQPTTTSGHPIYFQLEEYFILLQVETGDLKDRRFILDTGSPTTTIDPQLAEKLNLTKGKESTTQGIADTSRNAYQSHCTISFGGIQLPDFPVIVDAVNTPNTKTPIDGIIGFDVLSTYVVSIDYKHQTMRWQKPDARTDFSDCGTPLDITVLNGNPLIEVRLKNDDRWSKPTPMVLDTGNSAQGFIPLLPRFFTSNPDFKPAKKALHVAVKNTRISVSSCQAIELAPSLLIQNPVLGTFEQSQELEMSLDRLYGADGGFRGFIGIEVLRRFDVTLDFSRKRIYLKPNEEIGTPFKLR